MFSLKTFLFDTLPAYFKVNDTYQVDGKGLLERYLESIGLELDETLTEYVFDFTDIKNPATTPTEFLNYLSALVNNPVGLTADEVYFRRWLSRVITFYQLKGTLQGYKLFLKAYGLDCEVIEHTQTDTGTYDDDGTYDDGGNYDTGGCIACTEYTLLYRKAGKPLGHPELVDQPITHTWTNTVGTFTNPVPYHTYSIVNHTIGTNPKLTSFDDLTSGGNYRINIDVTQNVNITSLEIIVSGTTVYTWDLTGNITGILSTYVTPGSTGKVDVVLQVSSGVNNLNFRVSISKVTPVAYPGPPDPALIEMLENSICLIEPVRAKLRAMKEYVALEEEGPSIDSQYIVIRIFDGMVNTVTEFYTI